GKNLCSAKRGEDLLKLLFFRRTDEDHAAAGNRVRVQLRKALRRGGQSSNSTLRHDRIQSALERVLAKDADRKRFRCALLYRRGPSDEFSERKEIRRLYVIFRRLFLRANARREKQQRQEACRAQTAQGPFRAPHSETPRAGERDPHGCCSGSVHVICA